MTFTALGGLSGLKEAANVRNNQEGDGLIRRERGRGVMRGLAKSGSLQLSRCSPKFRNNKFKIATK